MENQMEQKIENDIDTGKFNYWRCTWILGSMIWGLGCRCLRFRVQGVSLGP